LSKLRKNTKALLLLLLVFLGLWGVLSVAQEEGTLIINSVPNGAAIILNGRYIGETPHTILVPQGYHEVVLSKPGYQDWKRGLFVIDGRTRTINATLTTIVPGNQAPVAAFNFVPTSPLVGGWVKFDASDPYDPDGTIASYAWDFGDGTSGSGSTAYHRFAAPGTYTVRLIVTDDDGGATDSTSRTIDVALQSDAPLNCPPAEHFTWDYEELIPGTSGYRSRGFPQDLKSLISSLQVTSASLISSDLPNILSFNLAFGDQIASVSGQVPDQSGSYRIIYDLLDEAGCPAILLTVHLSIRTKAITTHVQEVGLLHTFIGHSGSVNSVAFSPDGMLLASGSSDSTIKLWNVESGQLVRTITGHAGIVRSVAFSPDGILLASGSTDKTTKLWEVESGRLIRTIAGHTGSVASIAFSPDGILLASGSSDNTVKLSEVPTGQTVRSLKGDWISSIAFSPDGQLIAVPNFCDVKLCDVSTSREVRTLTPESKHWGVGSIQAISFSPNGDLLVSAMSSILRLWDLSNGREVAVFSDHSDTVRSVVFSPDSSLLVSGSSDDTIKLWNVDTGQMLASLPGHADIVESVAFSPNGKLIAAGGYNGTVRIWNVQDVLPIPERKTVCVQVSAVKMPHPQQATTACSPLETGQLVFQVQDDTGSFDMSPPFGVCRTPGTHFRLQAPAQFLTEEQQNFVFVRWEKYDEESKSYIPLSESPFLAIHLRQGGLARAVYQFAEDVQEVDSFPVASFTWEGLSPEGSRLLVKPKAGDRIRFDATASTDADGEIVKYEWDWDSNDTWDKETTNPVIEYQFIEAGTYQVTLRVTDNDGLTEKTTQTIVIEHRDLIQADFTFNVVDEVLHKIHLDASISIDTMGEIVRYEWDWDGDGVYDTAVQTPEMIHRFDGEGPYKVILTIVDDQGNRASCTKEVGP